MTRSALAGLIGSVLPGVAVCTSVVPIRPCHPLIVGAAVQTAHATTHGNFNLGLDPGVPILAQMGFAPPTTRALAAENPLQLHAELALVAAATRLAVPKARHRRTSPQYGRDQHV
jgi:hypothetical protein